MHLFEKTIDSVVKYEGKILTVCSDKAELENGAIVSRDVIGMRYGSLFDATQTMVSKMEDGNSLVQVVSWYDNENSYTSQMVRTIKYFAELA